MESSPGCVLLSKKARNGTVYIYSIPSKSTCTCVLKRSENEGVGEEKKIYIVAQNMSGGLPKKLRAFTASRKKTE